MIVVIRDKIDTINPTILTIFATVFKNRRHFRLTRLVIGMHLKFACSKVQFEQYCFKSSVQNHFIPSPLLVFLQSTRSQKSSVFLRFNRSWHRVVVVH